VPRREQQRSSERHSSASLTGASSHDWPGRLNDPGGFCSLGPSLPTGAFSGPPSRFPGGSAAAADPGTAADSPFVSLAPTLSGFDPRPAPRLAQWPPSSGCAAVVVMRTPAAPGDLLRWTAERSEPRIVFTLQLDEPDGSSGPVGNPLGMPGETLLPLVLAEPPGASFGEPSARQSGDDADAHLPPACRTPRGA
jgi:hypothetical protein